MAAIVLVTVGSWSSVARADAVDIGWLLTHVGGWERSPGRALALVVALMVLNYALNVLVIAVPAWKSGVAFRKAVLHLLGFTVIAQVADRIGAVASGVACSGILYVLNAFGVVIGGGLGTFLLMMLLGNFIISGVLVWFLTKFYCTRKWNLPKPRSNLIATAAAIFTNPAWAIGAFVF